MDRDQKPYGNYHELKWMELSSTFLGLEVVECKVLFFFFGYICLEWTMYGLFV
jgi:hypothetical protein